jgi:hypothetical protein
MGESGSWLAFLISARSRGFELWRTLHFFLNEFDLPD